MKLGENIKYPSSITFKFGGGLSNSKIKEIVQYTMDSSNAEELFIPEGEIEIDLNFIDKHYSYDDKIKYYIRQIERTRVLMIKKSYLDLILDCLTSKIIKEHCI